MWWNIMNDILWDEKNLEELQVLVSDAIVPTSQSLKSVEDCTSSSELIYWTEDGTDIWLTCDNDIIICTWIWTWYVIKACNVWSTVVWTWTNSYGEYI